MQQPDIPFVKDLVFVGGGHTHALVLRKWGMAPVPGVRVTVINPGGTAPYSGMLPGHIAGHYTRDELEIDLVRLARFAGARLIDGAVSAIDPEAKVMTVSGRAPIPYDIAAIDIGITSRMNDLEGFAEHGVPAKPLAVFADRWEAFCATPGDGPARIAVIGGGVAGVEVAMACAHRLQGLGRAAEVSVIDRGMVLDKVPPRARTVLRDAMVAHGVRSVEGDAPVRVGPEGVHLQSGALVEADLTIGAAGATPHPWLSECGFEMRDGYLVVDEYLRSVSHRDVYGAGDCIHLAHAPRPKAGVFAVRAAPVLGRNLRADLTGAQRKAFNPQRDFLKLISLGGKAALAEKMGFAFSGPGLWQWKDKIDQDFMEQFRHLPVMAPALPPKDAARGVAAALRGPAPCGGCGAKLGADTLQAVLQGTPGEDAAIVGEPGAQKVLSHDHLRGFAEDPTLVATVAAVHALGDIWAMGAKPEHALAQVILPPMEARMQGAWLSEIMEAARTVFEAAGAQIVGGHSSGGRELSVGFSVTGTLEREAITLEGAQAGDALILSRGIGVGVVMAAEMRMLATGDEVSATWAQMSHAQGDAAGILAAKAHAMTDVTGFGLAGHLGNICAASGVDATVDMAAVPLVAGARRLSAEGIHSTLYPQNRAAMEGHAEIPETPLGALMCDPQTAGGLLAAVPAEGADALVAALRAAGHDAARIGTVSEGSGRVRFR